MERTLVIGSRGSKLALTQAELIKAQLAGLAPNLRIRIEIIKTTGDVKNKPLSVIGGKGVFTKELEDALLDARIDIAVHSLKDLPTIIPSGLTIAAVCEREDPRDALVLRETVESASLLDLPPGAVVGTSSQRRLAQVSHVRGDLTIKDLRGNVDTRLRRLDADEYDALILAAAGLRRLGLERRISATISIDEMLPAVGQGALAIETRADDEFVIETSVELNHHPTQLACNAERAFLRALGGGCELPIAGYAVVSDNELTLHGLVANRIGSEIIRDQLSGTGAEAENLGADLAHRLLEQGARRLLD